MKDQDNAIAVSDSQLEIEHLLNALRDGSGAEPPRTFPKDRAAAALPGLYSWWCDDAGCGLLAGTLGHPLPSLIYAGLAGATKWPSGRVGTATLFSRIRQMHLGSQIDFSTFRWTLAALLMNHLGLEQVGARRLAPASEERLTGWMNEHLRVRAVPYVDRATLGSVEAAVLAALDPPLNLMGMPSTPIRKQLTLERAKLARPPHSGAPAAAAKGTLVVVPCGGQKIWKREPDHGPAPAREAYTSSYFQKNRAYAEAFGSRWVVLSAKYGFIDPEFVIPNDYDVTFKDPRTDPISVASLTEQVRTYGLDAYPLIIGLGGSDYQLAIEQAFLGTGARLEFPFAGMSIGKRMQATDAALGAISVGPEHSPATGSWRSIMARGEQAARLLGQDRERGQAEFRGLIARYPGDGMLFLKRGIARAAAGDQSAAIDDLVQAERLLPVPSWKERARAERASIEGVSAPG